MKEAYLHYLWRQKKIAIHKLKLTDGSSFTIKKFGTWNSNESGPDFLNAEVIIDGIRWVGNIEMHIFSSDWYVHNHHFDPAYNNVILHVVFQDNNPVKIEGRPIPTLELKEVIQKKDYSDFENFIANIKDYPCQSLLESIDPIYLESMKEKVITDRISRKAFQFEGTYFENDPKQILYSLLGQAFGCKLNAKPFQELTNRLPIRILKKEHVDLTGELVKGVSGIFHSPTENLNHWPFLQQKYELKTMEKYTWKQKGLRPASFPEKRVIQFIAIVKKFDFDTAFTFLTPPKLKDYLLKLLESPKDTPKITETMKELVIINCFVPFLWWYGNFKSNDSIQQKAIDLLSLLPSEQNNTIKMWKKSKVFCKNSYDSQALLEIYNEYCFMKKCLSCSVGVKILNL